MAVYSYRNQGDTVASCDSYGVVKIWDVRAVAPMLTIDIGPHPTNKVQFDPSSSVLAVACNDSIVRIYEIANGKVNIPSFNSYNSIITFWLI